MVICWCRSSNQLQVGWRQAGKGSSKNLPVFAELTVSGRLHHQSHTEITNTTLKNIFKQSFNSAIYTLWKAKLHYFQVVSLSTESTDSFPEWSVWSKWQGYMQHHRARGGPASSFPYWETRRGEETGERREAQTTSAQWTWRHLRYDTDCFIHL